MSKEPTDFWEVYAGFRRRRALRRTFALNLLVLNGLDSVSDSARPNRKGMDALSQTDAPALISYGRGIMRNALTAELSACPKTRADPM